MLFLRVAWTLLSAATLAGASATEIPMTLYTDNSCGTPSTTAANASLNIDVCTVTPGLGSFVLDPFPCSSGSVTAYAFSDTACGNVDDVLWSGGRDSDDPNCYGPFSGDLAAIMLSCNRDTPGQPSSTTTINVGLIATAASPTSTSTSTSTANSFSGDGSSTTSGTGTASSFSSGWNSLDLGTRIGIIIALAVGIPPILLGIYTIQLQKKKKAEREAAEEEARSHGTPMHPYPSPYMYGGGSNGYFHSQTVLLGSSPPAPKPGPSMFVQNWPARL